MPNEPEPRKLELAPELVAVQSRLANLSPKALRIDRDQLMFNAGRASASQAMRSTDLVECPDAVRVERSRSTGASAHAGATGSASVRLWPATTAAMTAATILLAAMLLHERGSQFITNETKPLAAAVSDSQGATTDLLFTSRTSLSRASSGYLGVRNTALTRGVDALATQFDTEPSVSPSQTKPATARDLRDELLPTSLRQRG